VHAGSDKDRMTAILPLFASGLIFRRRKKQATAPTTDTEQQLRFDKTQALLLVAQHMAERKPYDFYTFYENMVYLRMIALLGKTLHNWVIHDSLWLPQLQALMNSPDLRLKLHTAMVLTRKRNPELQNAAWFMARMFIQSERMLATNLHLHPNIHEQFNWISLMLGPNIYYEGGRQMEWQHTLPIWPSNYCRLLQTAVCPRVRAEMGVSV
jgi:hypothetical protein